MSSSHGCSLVARALLAWSGRITDTSSQASEAVGVGADGCAHASWTDGSSGLPFGDVARPTGKLMPTVECCLVCKVVMLFGLVCKVTSTQPWIPPTTKVDAGESSLPHTRLFGHVLLQSAANY